MERGGEDKGGVEVMTGANKIIITQSNQETFTPLHLFHVLLWCIRMLKCFPSSVCTQKPMMTIN